jgi:two-component system, OmpR family, phosphate regulon sensor histidine kinase PhoR
MEDHKSEGGPILLHPDKTPYEFEEIPLIRSVLQSEVVKNEEIIYIRKDGVKGVLSISSAPIFDNDSKVIAVVATFSDTAQHK